MIKVLALDPGRTTGYALGMLDGEQLEIECGQKQMSHKELWDFIPPDIDHIICETFTYRHLKDKADLYPCELIGVVRLWTDWPNLVTLHMQEPAIQGKKAFFTDSRLKQMQLYLPGVEHGRSALKHLLQWHQFGPGFQYYASNIKLTNKELSESPKTP